METIAIYWEPVIKTYGIIERTGLSLVSLALDSTRSDPAIIDYLDAARTRDNVKIVFASGATDEGLRVNILLDGEAALPGDGDSPPGLRVDAPVELVYFQGPHFGDRYGIAQAALDALADANIALRSMVCAGASVYLVVPEGQAGAAGKALTKAFAVPNST